MSLEHTSFDLSPNTTCFIVFTRGSSGACFGTAKVTSNGLTSDRALVMTRGESFELILKRAREWAVLLTGPLSQSTDRMLGQQARIAPSQGGAMRDVNHASTDFDVMRRSKTGGLRRVA